MGWRRVARGRAAGGLRPARPPRGNGYRNQKALETLNNPKHTPTKKNMKHTLTKNSPKHTLNKEKP